MNREVAGGTGRYTFAIHAQAAAPPEVVFALLADARSWPRWSFVPAARLEREGLPAPDGVGAIRRFGLGLFGSREQVIVYEPPYRFAYTMLSGMPVRGYRADVELRRTASGTALLWRASFDTIIPGTGPLLGLALRLIVHGFARGLTSYANRPATRQPH